MARKTDYIKPWVALQIPEDDPFEIEVVFVGIRLAEVKKLTLEHAVEEFFVDSPDLPTWTEASDGSFLLAGLGDECSVKWLVTQCANPVLLKGFTKWVV